MSFTQPLGNYGNHIAYQFYIQFIVGKHPFGKDQSRHAENLQKVGFIRQSEFEEG